MAQPEGYRPVLPLLRWAPMIMDLTGREGAFRAGHHAAVVSGCWVMETARGCNEPR